MKKKKHCLHCSRKVYARGCCWIHYREFQNRVYFGKTSWRALMRRKQVLPVKKHYARKRRS